MIKHRLARFRYISKKRKDKWQDRLKDYNRKPEYSFDLIPP
jgi:hypothetical protein